MKKLLLCLILSLAICASAFAKQHPTRVLVKFKPGANFTDAAKLHQQLGATFSKKYTSVPDLHEVKVPAGRSVDQVVANYKANDAVAYAQPDYVVPLNETIPDDISFENLWGLHNTGQMVASTTGTPGADIEAAEAWDIWTGNDSVRVAIIDSGIDPNHPDLAGNLWVNTDEIPDDGIDNDGNGYVDDIHGFNFIDWNGNIFDDNSHGTHIAGTIGGVGNNGGGVTGVAWNVSLVALKYATEEGSGFTSDIIEAIDYCIAENILISSNSYGILFDIEGGPSAMKDAIEAAKNMGHLYIASAGNNGVNLDSGDWFYYPAMFPLDNILVVTAYDKNDNLSPVFNYGHTAVDIGAPGVSIYSTMPGNQYGYKSGTSMAVPHVAGVAALLKSQNPSFTYHDIIDRITRLNRPVASLVGKTATGGSVSAFRAFNDCNTNGVQDDVDIAQGTSLDCNGDVIPDECQIDCNNNSIPDDCDISSGTSQDCSSNGIPDECEVDCNNNQTADTCDILAGEGLDCNGNWALDSCEVAEEDCNNDGKPDDCPDVDCNQNSHPDSCDIVEGISNDCNLNGIPDKCELISDCDNDGYQDLCQMFLGELDLNGNNILDVCESTFRAAGSRSVYVNVPDLGNPVAIRISNSCVSKYVQPDASLGDTPHMFTEAVSIYVKSADIVPDKDYEIRLFDGATVSKATTVHTDVYGDVNGNGVANFADVQATILLYQGSGFLGINGIHPFDVEPCTPNSVINMGDVLVVVLAFQNKTYAEGSCCSATNCCP